MIRGLYEAHLPVKDLDRSIVFYRGLGLELAKRYDHLAFFWIEKRKSWLGLWHHERDFPYHPASRHIAFQVSLDDLKRAKDWLKERGIEVREAFGFRPFEPIVMPDQAHAMIYFRDPDGNSLEFITPLPDPPKEMPMMYLSRWESQHRTTP